MEIMKRVIMFQMMMIILLLCLMMIRTTAKFSRAEPNSYYLLHSGPANLSSTTAETSNVIDPSCQADCGNNVSIAYPFGIGAGCYADDWFEVVCINDTSSSSGSDPRFKKPFLKRFNLEVLNIQVEDATVRVNYPIFSKCDNFARTSSNRSELAGSPFVFSESDNWFIAMTNICNITTSLWSPDDLVSYGGCRTACRGPRSNGCNHTDEYCCRTTIPSNFGAFITKIEPPTDYSNNTIEGCSYGFLVEYSWFLENFTNPAPNMSVPVVLDWGIFEPTFVAFVFLNSTSNLAFNNANCVGYNAYNYDPTSDQNNSTIVQCSCESGFRGNPYLPYNTHVGGGCQDIDECDNVNRTIRGNCGNDARCENTYGSYRCISAKDTRLSIIIGISTSLGVLVMLIGGWWSYKVVKKRKMIKQRKKFFKRNGGLLLQQQLYSSEGNVENNKLFSSKDLEKATDHFNANRILGQGGQGTVYKGMLTDGRIVAIKKSKIIDEGQLEGFINEVVILSKINHRNIVKLLGCCLETEVPLLVYEFIPNGTLSQYLIDQNEEFPLTWEIRLRVAKEVAGALFYLHSAASSPIYHRDIKSTNILLDDKYRAKVADFGTSRSIPLDQTHLTTVVQGTFGYLDPEYFQTSQFTEKSDVYSFGVVLAELLTSEKVISSTRAPGTKSLATYFTCSMEENRLFDIVDSQVLKEAGKEEIIAIANLVKRCLNFCGRKRPAMKEVAMELEAITTSHKASDFHQNNDENEFAKADMNEEWDVDSTMNSSVASSLDARPLLISS